MINTIHNCNNMDLLKTMPDNFVDNIITDVPYGLQDIDALKLIKENQNNTRGFMNREWDVIPTTEMLTEFNRVLKYGGFFVTTFSARSDLQTVFQYRLLEAGFDISFSPILWNFQTGFPKAANFSKIAQKRSGNEPYIVGRNPNSRENCNKENTIYKSGTVGKTDFITKPTTDEAKYMEGLYSCQLKPAYEPILIAQKKYKEKSQIDHITTWYKERKELLDKGIQQGGSSLYKDIKEEDLSLYTKNSSGAVSIDLARIPFDSNEKQWEYPNGAGGVYSKEYQQNNDNAKKWNSFSTTEDNKPIQADSNGRYPATILVSNNALDVGRETKTLPRKTDATNKGYMQTSNKYSSISDIQDQGDLSRYFSLDAWTKKNQPNLYKLSKKALELQHDTKIIYPFLNTSKPSRAEANAGLDSFEVKEVDLRTEAGKGSYTHKASKNTHVTKKPISLFCYLITLFSSKENDIILDPFCGSGATCIASVLTNRKYIGIDITKEYCDIAEARVEYWKAVKEEKDLQCKNGDEINLTLF